MSMSDNIKNNISKAKNDMDSEEEVRNLLNSAVSKSLQQFIQKLQAGEIPTDNMSDFVRVLGAYKDINNISDGMEGSQGEGALPELNMRSEKAINDTVEEEKRSEDSVNVQDMTQDELDDLMRRVDIGQNQDNEESF